MEVVLKAVVYLSQDNNSIHSATIDHRLKKLDLKLVEVFKETTTRRSAFKRMLRQAQTDRFEVVVFWSLLDGNVNSLADLIIQMGFLLDRGKRLIFIKDDIDTVNVGYARLIRALADYVSALSQRHVLNEANRPRGRPRKINRQHVANLRAQNLKLTDIAREMGTTKGAISKILAAKNAESGDGKQVS